MAKFDVECWACGQPVPGTTGLFAKKKGVCRCGTHVDLERMGYEVCPVCCETFRYDRCTDNDLVCPDCGFTIDRAARFEHATRLWEDGESYDNFLPANLEELRAQWEANRTDTAQSSDGFLTVNLPEMMKQWTRNAEQAQAAEKADDGFLTVNLQEVTREPEEPQAVPVYNTIPDDVRALLEPVSLDEDEDSLDDLDLEL